MKKSKKKERIDVLLVERGLEDSCTRAQARIIAGDVIVNDHRVDKPGTMVAKDAEIRLRGKGIPYVSRGGLKLAKAIKLWPAQIKGAVCLDVGASTGGFTDVLLQNGAKKVFAVDVGYGQIDWKLRNDPRVENLERTHILKVPEGTFEPKPSIVVIDVSFISLKRVLPGVVKHLAPNATVYALIKPQFEVGKEWVEKGGIVRDEAARQDALEKVINTAGSLGLELIGHAESPIKGADGNVEFVAAFRRSS